MCCCLLLPCAAGANALSGVGGRRSLFTQRNKMRQLKSLEQDANQFPDDAYKQLRFLQELNKNYPALVVRRIEENRFVVDEAIQKEYIKALVKYVVCV